MKILVTAGNTQAPLDAVRCVTNVFSGKTGAQIASRAHERGHDLTLLTSHPEALDRIPAERPRSEPGWTVRTYRTFHELDALMEEHITAGGCDAVVHAAAVSDYLVAGVFGLADETRFDDDKLALVGPPRFADVRAGKVKSHHSEVWVRMTPAPKLIDRVRFGWGFRGTLVKFKLEVGVTDEQLLEIAENSRVHSLADLIAANTLEGMHEWAYLGAKEYAKVPRGELADRLIDRVEEIATTFDRR